MNRSTIGQTGTNRELQYANLIIERRHDLVKQSGHLRRVSSSGPLVGSSPGLTASSYPHILRNPKQRMMEDDRRAEIDHENMILLNKMRMIFSRGTLASNSGTSKPMEIEPRSLNHGYRKRELERITRENLGIVHRIRSRRPNYSRDEHGRQRRATEDILQRISRHGHRRTDNFISSVGLHTSSSVSALSNDGSQARRQPRRLQPLLSDPYLPNGLAVSVTEELYGYAPTRSASDVVPQYGDNLLQQPSSTFSTASLGRKGGRASKPRATPDDKALAASMSCDSVRPASMSLRGANGEPLPEPASARMSAGGGGLPPSASAPTLAMAPPESSSSRAGASTPPLKLSLEVDESESGHLHVGVGLTPEEEAAPPVEEAAAAPEEAVAAEEAAPEEAVAPEEAAAPEEAVAVEEAAAEEATEEAAPEEAVAAEEAAEEAAPEEAVAAEETAPEEAVAAEEAAAEEAVAPEEAVAAPEEEVEAEAAPEEAVAAEEAAAPEEAVAAEEAAEEAAPEEAVAAEEAVEVAPPASPPRPKSAGRDETPDEAADAADDMLAAFGEDLDDL